MYSRVFSVLQTRLRTNFGNFSCKYDVLSALEGVYAPYDSRQATQDNPLYSALQKLMTDTHTNQSVVYSGYSATALATYWASTDAAAGTGSYLYSDPEWQF